MLRPLGMPPLPPSSLFPPPPGLTDFDPSTFWAAVTHDATPKAGAAKGCAANTQRAFDAIFQRAGSEEGRRELRSTFALCDGELEGEGDVETLAYWVQGAFDR